MPGDTVFWHTDICHAVGDEHAGRECANVIYIGSARDCPKNREYLPKQWQAFLPGRSAPDFAAIDFEVDFKGRATEEDLTDLGRGNYISCDTHTAVRGRSRRRRPRIDTPNLNATILPVPPVPTRRPVIRKTKSGRMISSDVGFSRNGASGSLIGVAKSIWVGEGIAFTEQNTSQGHLRQIGGRFSADTDLTESILQGLPPAFSSSRNIQDRTQVIGTGTPATLTYLLRPDHVNSAMAPRSKPSPRASSVTRHGIVFHARRNMYLLSAILKLPWPGTRHFPVCARAPDLRPPSL
jgi:hypothetical protein